VVGPRPLTRSPRLRLSLRSPLIGTLTAPGIALIATSWPWRNRGRWTQEALQSTIERPAVTGPAGVTGSLHAGLGTPSPVSRRDLRARDVAGGLSHVDTRVHAQEPSAGSAVERVAGAPADGEGRNALRHRPAVAHPCARMDQLQGQRARYPGPRKTPLELRRTAAVHNPQPRHGVQGLERVAGFR
jgi:hypothetical protein